jgi:hypothetical protein
VLGEPGQPLGQGRHVIDLEHAVRSGQHIAHPLVWKVLWFDQQ